MRNKFMMLIAAPVLLVGPMFVNGLLAAVNVPDPPKVSLPAPNIKEASANKAVAVLAGGCFWGMQGIYEHMKGVTKTVVGYSGGKANTATYERVEEGDTNHAESIQITYDPKIVTYGDLLKVYFSVAHDPTTLNRQHYDVGTQYRSSIFYANDEQKTIAEQYIQELNAAHVFRSPIVTKVVPLDGFYAAEEYHQHFLDHNPTQGYIAAMDIPLLKDFQQKYPELYVKESR